MLTDLWLKSVVGKSQSERAERADRDGMSARVTLTGKVIFQIRYRFHGRATRLDIGSYPLMSLKEARDENRRLRKQLEQGHDPKIVKQLEKQAIKNATLLSALHTQWHESYCVENKKNHHEIKRSFELYILPKLGHLPAEKITLHDWLAILEPLAKDKPAIADRLLTNSKQLLKWALKRQLVPSNPLSDINAKEDLQIKKVAGARSLSDEEIKMVWMAMEQSRMSDKNVIFLKLCLIYGCRNGELRIALKSHFDFEKKVWTIPPENHKMGKRTQQPLLRPIIPETEKLLLQAFALSEGSDHVFTNYKTNDPIGQGVPLALPYNINQHLRRHHDYHIEHWTAHDLRKTARSNFSTLCPPHIAEVLLGHAINGSQVWRTYDHYDYLPEQADALNQWVERLDMIIGGADLE